MTKQNAVQRLVDRNAEASKGALKVPPDQTVEHAVMVEARLIQAMAARKKKERTAGGAGAADLAQSILDQGLSSDTTRVNESGVTGQIDDDDSLAELFGVEQQTSEALEINDLDPSSTMPPEVLLQVEPYKQVMVTKKAAGNSDRLKKILQSITNPDAT